MSLIKSTPIVNPFALDPAQLDTPAAHQARAAGLLQVKRAAAQRAERLARWGRPLLVGVIVVSALHIFETLAGFRPSSVAAPTIHPVLYHATAGALTLAIDLAALYLTAARGVLALAGVTRRWYGLAFFLALTALLNAAYMLRYAPDLDAGAVLPTLDGAFAVLLPLAIPVAIASVEGAAQQLEAARLALLVEAAALRPAAEATQVEAPAPGWRGEVLVARPALAWAREQPFPAPVKAPTRAPSAPPAMPGDARAESMERIAEDAPPPPAAASGEQLVCPRCARPLDPARWRAARRWGRCAGCKTE